MMIFLAWVAKNAEFPIDVVGIMFPFSSINEASIIATSIGAICQQINCSTVSLKC